MKNRLALMMAAGVGLLAGAASAHDFFLIPERFVGPSNRPLIVHATSSSDFPALNVGSPRSRIAQVRAMVAGEPAAVTVEAQTGQSLRLSVAGADAGMAVVALETIWGESNWRPEQVETYLDEHPFKAEDVSTVHGLLPEGATLQIRSRRLAKTLVCFEVCSPTATTPAGLEVEFLPEFDTGRSSPGAFQLVRKGQPLAGYPVVVRFGQDERRELLTDGQGRVQLPEGVTGPVMMVAATLDRPNEPGGRFITNNASLTFDASAGSGQ